MKYLKLVTILGAICLALVVLAEVIVRVLFPVPLEPPGGILLTNDIPGIKSSVSFDYDGDRLRSVAWSKGAKSDNLRILALGGNGTTAILQSAPDAWWGQLAGKLGAAAGKPIEVAAPIETGGGKALSAAVTAEKILEKYEVDLVIVMLGFMDAIGTPADAKFMPGALDRMRKLEPVGAKYQLAKFSHLVRIARNGKTKRLQSARQKDFTKPNYYRDFLVARGRFLGARPVLDRIERTGDDPAKNYLLALDALAAAAKANGAQLLVIGEPTIYKSSFSPAEESRLTIPWLPKTPSGDKSEPVSAFRIRPLTVETELQRFYRLGEERTKSLGGEWLNLQGEIPRFPDYFITETYLSDKGAEAVADAILPSAAKLLEISGVAPPKAAEGEGS